ncbi:hypothetical protein DSL64_02965 [Dyadobacter luteus]|uniref:Molybdenum ABC transporter permease n=1 Tax=Dyadobacter luteus TaxID=2259619 RepID=A0A3D8YFT3_9BACT|nr:hypothetical protein [Dyadobacter luteus]REA63424.1 hypothetical protein DSL64_02965 [Dyadobacter luteus]
MANPFNTLTLLGTLSVLAGLLLRLLIGKRKFERRGAAGLQRFDSFWSFLIIIFLESVGAAVSLLLTLIGILLLIAGYFI